MIQDTGKAKLPALPGVTDVSPSLAKWVQAVNERLEVREGNRGNPAERAVTVRELKALGLNATAWPQSSIAGGNVLVQRGDGSFVRVAMSTFTDEIRKTKLYTDLMKSIDDATRFDDVPAELRELLLRSLADEAAARGADITRLERKVQSATSSLAYTVETVTASIAGVSAGVRESTYASAIANEATAGKITQVQARLDNFAGGAPGTATIEEKMSTTASAVTGLEAQYTLKVASNGAIAGIGLSATTSTAGVSTSAVIIQADKFALVGSNQTVANPTSPSVSMVPFGYDSATNTLYLNGKIRINSGGQLLETAALPGPAGATGATGPRGSVTRYGYGSWSDSTATALVGYSPVAGDTVTLSTGSSATTRYWNGWSWVDPGVVIDGNLLVAGSLTAGTMAASKVQIGLSAYLSISSAYVSGGVYDFVINIPGAIGTPLFTYACTPPAGYGVSFVLTGGDPYTAYVRLFCFSLSSGAGYDGWIYNVKAAVF